MPYYLVRDKLSGATQVHTLGFHEYNETNPAATPIQAACTDPNGKFSTTLLGPKNYKVSVNAECWASPGPPINPPGGGLLPVPLPNPPGANLTLTSPCTNAHPAPAPCDGRCEVVYYFYDSEELVTAGVYEPRAYLHGYRWDMERHEVDAADGSVHQLEINLTVIAPTSQTGPPWMNGVEPIPDE